MAIAFVAVAIGAGAGGAAADDGREAALMSRAFPEADAFGAFTGSPPAAPAYRDGALVGYVFSTGETVGSVGYSGKPLDILVGMTLDGLIAGAALRSHSEPILVIGLSDADLERYVDAFAGLSVTGRIDAAATGEDARGVPDAIAGATVSSAVMRDSIVRAGRSIARSRGLAGLAAEGPRLDRESYEPATWDELIADGSIVHRRFSMADVAERFSGSDVVIAEDTRPEQLFIELFLALITPPRIGENLLGKLDFNRLAAQLEGGEQAIVVAANGLYSFRGTEYIRSGVFDRVRLVQGENVITLVKERHEPIERLEAAGAPELRELGIFTIPEDAGFDPLKAWRLELIVRRQAEGGQTVERTFSVAYELPERYLLAPPPPTAASTDESPAMLSGFVAPGLWQEIWRARWLDVVIIVVILAALTVILVFQDTLAVRRRLHRWLRIAFLSVTLVWIGLYAGAQLSVVNVLTFAHALMSDFRWEFFLLDPVVFVLWSYVAVALVFWGRGVFCGWLCPFGALQELLGNVARRLRIREIRVPFRLHERLWPIKYVLFIGLFAVSLNSMTLAFIGAEVEPFKTVITLKFMRHWPFVVYAVALLVAGLFIERFFCRFLCPLGAALALPARLRMFEWLKRHPQCGTECAICEHKCPVQAIHPEGSINPNECIYCLNCQTLYYDDHICPPLVARRKRKERREAIRSGQSVSIPGNRAAS